MRTVVLYELLSLDGVAERPERFFADWDEVVDRHLRQTIATQDAVILGRRSYEQWSEFWPSSDVEPFATFINTVAKHVATSTPLTGQWTNATAIDGDLVEFVRDLKDAPGGDIGIHASLSVARALLAADTVDEVRLTVAPALVGRGQRLLGGLPPLHLELLHGTTSPSGYLVADYRVADHRVAR